MISCWDAKSESRPSMEDINMVGAEGRESAIVHPCRKLVGPCLVLQRLQQFLDTLHNAKTFEEAYAPYQVLGEGVASKPAHPRAETPGSPEETRYGTYDY